MAKPMSPTAATITPTMISFRNTTLSSMTLVGRQVERRRDEVHPSFNSTVLLPLHPARRREE
jgi:hypothetical protein